MTAGDEYFRCGTCAWMDSINEADNDRCPKCHGEIFPVIRTTPGLSGERPAATTPPPTRAVTPPPTRAATVTPPASSKASTTTGPVVSVASLHLDAEPSGRDVRINVQRGPELDVTATCSPKTARAFAARIVRAADLAEGS